LRFLSWSRHRKRTFLLAVVIVSPVPVEVGAVKARGVLPGVLPKVPVEVGVVARLARLNG
jgi:hypothetical protein